MWNNIPRYQSGGYIPGLSSQIFGAGLGRDIRTTQQDLREKAKGLEKSQWKQKFGGFVGGKGGKWMGTALAAAIGGPLAAIALPALMSGAGTYFGSKMMGRGPKVGQGKTGLLGSQYDILSGIRGDMPESWKGAALATGGMELLSGLKSEAGKELMGNIGSKFNLGQYGEAAGVDPSAAMQNLSQVQGPTGRAMGRRMPEIGEYRPPGSGAGLEFTQKGFAGRNPLQAAEGMGEGGAGLRFGRQAAGGAFSPEMHQSMLPTSQELMGSYLPSAELQRTVSDFTPQFAESPDMGGGLMNLLRSGAGQAGNVLTNLGYGAQDWHQSFQNQKPYWWQDPKVAEWNQQGDPSRVMGSQFGYQEGGEVDPERYAGLLGKMIGKFGGDVPEGMYTPGGGRTKAGYADILGAEPESINIDTLSYLNPANYRFKVSGKGKESGIDVGGTDASAGKLPLEELLNKVMYENIEDPFERMEWNMKLKEVSPYSNLKRYQQGGHVPQYQMGGLIQYRKGY